MIFSDSHCHLDFFPNPLAIVTAARQAGVQRIIIPAVTAEYWPRLAALTTETGIWGAYGLHPLYRHQNNDLEQLEDYLTSGKAIAVGECGLDFARAGEDKAQIALFTAQLHLAQQYHLPVLIHARQALDKVLQLLQKNPVPRFVVHSFTGSDVQLARLLALGGYVGIGGTATYPRAQRLRRQIATLPANRYVLETDAPDQPLCGRQGVPNEPRFIPEIAAQVAILRGESIATVSRTSEENFNRLLGLTA